MAEDIKIQLDQALLEGDLKFTNGDLLREKGLSTAVEMSLYTDRRADNEDPFDNEDKRGWWGDQFETNDEIGSKLWLLNRASTKQQNIIFAKGYIKEALQWMIDDGVVVSIDIDVFRQDRYGIEGQGDILAARMRFYNNDGTTKVIKYNDLWEGQFEEE